jgi:formylglycine-generating enzyme
MGVVDGSMGPRGRTGDSGPPPPGCALPARGALGVRRRASDTTASPRVLFGVVLLTALIACGGGLPGSPELLPTETPAAVFGSSEACEWFAPQPEPDLMAWAPSSRANLKMLHEQGVVAVRYEAKNCAVSLEVLDCVGEEQYDFSPYGARETKIATTERELLAELPLGGSRLEGEVGDGRALRTDYMLVGVQGIRVRSAYDGARLRGKCERATHVISKIFVGGFGMAAGRSEVLAAGATVFGVGGGLRQEREAERLVQEGDPEACEVAQRTGAQEPRCSVPLRVGLTPIVGRADGGCPSGTHWDGQRCVGDRAVVSRCPAGTEIRDGECRPTIDTSCPPGLVFEEGVGCRPVSPEPTPRPPTRSVGDTPGSCGPDMAFFAPTELSVDEPSQPRVALAPFCLDRTEVTVGAYRACIRSGRCEEPPWNSPCNARGSDDLQPINCVSWQHAATHCIAVGKRLPTEHEWEWAARGAERRSFPWGEQPPGALLVNGCGAECQPAAHALHLVDDRWPNSAPVGSFPAGATPEGVLDMAGNLAEWTASPWCHAGDGPCNELFRVVRGGHHRSHLADSLRGSARQRLPLDPGNPYVGFRCARSALESDR